MGFISPIPLWTLATPYSLWGEDIAPWLKTTEMVEKNWGLV